MYVPCNVRGVGRFAEPVFGHHVNRNADAAVRKVFFAKEHGLPSAVAFVGGNDGLLVQIAGDFAVFRQCRAGARRSPGRHGRSSRPPGRIGRCVRGCKRGRWRERPLCPCPVRRRKWRPRGRGPHPAMPVPPPPARRGAFAPVTAAAREESRCLQAFEPGLGIGYLRDIQDEWTGKMSQRLETGAPAGLPRPGMARPSRMAPGGVAPRRVRRRAQVCQKGFPAYRGRIPSSSL